MSAVFPVSARSFLVTLDTLTFYATSWKLSGERQYTEQTGATGDCYLSNSSNRAKRLVLEGCFSFVESPADVVIPLEEALAEQTRFGFTLREIRYTGLRLYAYQIEECSDVGVLPCQLTFLTTGTLQKNSDREVQT